MWHKLALAAILLLAAFLNFYRITAEGYGNQYYAAAIKSMLMNWHNFFFVSFDPAGFVSVDKPPLGLWVQTASAWLFGFEGWALMLPQALAGVLSVWLMYVLVKRVFAPTAGVISALVLAVTPISVATNRNNTMDSLLVLTSLLAAWAVSIATKKGKLRWLLLCAVLVGMGFNIKMLQAFLVLPALFLLYLVAAPLKFWKRVGHLALATLVLLAVSLSWAVAVDLTPPENRPYMGSSQGNSVMELIIGHNGMSRLLPGGLRRMMNLGNPQPGPGGPSQGGYPRPGMYPPPYGQPPYPPPGQPTYPPPPGGTPGQSPPPPYGGMPGQPRPPSGPNQPGAGQPFSSETGEPGALRLLNKQLAGQATWLLPLAALGLMAAAWQTRLRKQLDRRHQALFLWLAWLLPQMVFFSIANLFHRYYLCMIAPGIAALLGAGLVAMWEDYRRPGRKGWLLPLAVLLTAAVETTFLAYWPDWSRWLTPLILSLSILAAIALLILRFTGRPSARYASRFRLAFAALGMTALLLAPIGWSLTPILYGGDSGLPYAGPDLSKAYRQTERMRPPGVDNPKSNPLIDYLSARQGDEKFILATLRANDAAPFILATGEPVMALGGFSGTDPILTADELAARVQAGEVRFFLLSGENRQQAELIEWVRRSCAALPVSDWQPGAGPQSPQAHGGPSGAQQPAGQGGSGGNPELFDCGSQK